MCQHFININTVHIQLLLRAQYSHVEHIFMSIKNAIHYWNCDVTNSALYHWIRAWSAHNTKWHLGSRFSWTLQGVLSLLSKYLLLPTNSLVFHKRSSDQGICSSIIYVLIFSSQFFALTGCRTYDLAAKLGEHRLSAVWNLCNLCCSCHILTVGILTFWPPQLFKTSWCMIFTYHG